MAFTLDELTELEKALATGTLSVKYQDKEVVYRSVRDMQEIRQLMRQELGLDVGLEKPIRAQVIFNNGL